MTGPQAWRITDGDRLAAVEALGEHYVAGRLDEAEHAERIEQASAARTNLELAPLFTDLPRPHGSATPTPTPTPTPSAYAPAVAQRWRTHPRRRLFPWVLLIVPVAFLLHAPWLIFFVLLATWVLRPGRRHWR